MQTLNASEVVLVAGGKDGPVGIVVAPPVFAPRPRPWPWFPVER